MSDIYQPYYRKLMMHVNKGEENPSYTELMGFSKS